MPKRRANGEGNIRKRKDGRWEGRYTVGYDPESGKRIIKNVLGKTQAEVKEKLKRAIEENVGIDYGRAKTYTVGTWLIVLPEMWNTGYALDQLDELADENGERTKNFLSAFAKKHDVNIVGGSCAVKRQGKFWNTAYDFDRKGQLINEYDKVHLFGLMQEDRFIAPGNSESSFEIDGIKSSCVICYDIRFPEWERKLMSSGAKILFVSAQWPDVRIKQWEILLRARAIENQAFVVAANRVGDAPNDHFNGHSLIIDPFGEIIANGCSGQEEIVSAILDLSLVDKARGNIPVFKDRRLDLY